MILRRLRGLLGTTVLGMIPWTLVGAAVGLVLEHGLIPGMRGIRVFSPFSDSLPVNSAVIGAMIGAMNGLLFGMLVLVTQRGKTLHEVNAWRFAATGAAASAAVMGLVFGSPVVALASGLLGAATSSATLRLAQRAEQRGLLEAGDPTHP